MRALIVAVGDAPLYLKVEPGRGFVDWLYILFKERAVASAARHDIYGIFGVEFFYDNFVFDRR